MCYKSHISLKEWEYWNGCKGHEPESSFYSLTICTSQSLKCLTQALTGQRESALDCVSIWDSTVVSVSGTFSTFFCRRQIYSQPYLYLLNRVSFRFMAWKMGLFPFSLFFQTKKCVNMLLYKMKNETLRISCNDFYTCSIS